MKEKEAQIQAKVIGMPLFDFLCNISRVLIEFLRDGEAGLDTEYPVRMKKGERCVLGFYGDCYVGDGDIICLTGIIGGYYEGSELYKPSCIHNKPTYIQCEEIFNETRNLVSISSFRVKGEKSKKDKINLKGVIMGDPSYGNNSKSVFFPLKIETSITATFKKNKYVLQPGDALLIQSYYYCYVRKGDTIQIKQGEFFKYTSKKTGKSSLLLKTKDFFDETLGIPMMPC